MIFLELNADTLALDQEPLLETVVDPNRQIAECAANHQFARDLGILLVPEHLGQHVRDNGDCIGLVQVAIPRRLKYLLEFRYTGFDAVFDFLCNLHE